MISKNTISIFDYYSNIILLNLSHGINYNEDKNENDNAINSANIKSAMVLSTNYDIIQIIVSDDGKYLLTISSKATVNIYNPE